MIKSDRVEKREWETWGGGGGMERAGRGSEREGVGRKREGGEGGRVSVREREGGE